MKRNDRERFETFRAGHGHPPAVERPARLGIPYTEAQRAAAYRAEARAIGRTRDLAHQAQGLNGTPKHDRRS